MNIIEQKKAMRGQGGFTLIELLVVIAILAILAGLAVIGIGQLKSTANNTACAADLDTYNTASQAFAVGNNGTPAADLNALETSSYLKHISKYKATFTLNTTTGEVTSSDINCKA